MNITFLLPPVNMSGGIRVIAIHAQKLAARGHRVTLVSTPKPKTRKLHHIQAALGLRKPPKSHLDTMGLDHRVLDEARPIVDADVPDADAVIATWWETAEWAARLSPRKGRKFYFVQGYEIFHEAGADRCRATYRLPLKKIVVARWLAKVMANEYGDNDCEIVHNSVDHAQFHAPARAKQARPTVGMLFSDAPVKGVDVALRAVNMLRAQFPDLRVISFGSSRPGMHEGDLGEFHFDPPQDSIRDLYASCDVWIAASRSEGFNLTAMEAMACRTPVVSTKTGWPEEAIADGVNGALVEIDDARGLADAAASILRLPDDRWQAMSAAAYDTVRDSSWDRCADLFEQALKKRSDQRITRPRGRRPRMTVSKTLDAGLPRSPGPATSAAPSLGRLWQWSDRVCEQKGWRRLKARAGFVLAARRLGQELAPFDASSGALARAMAHRPEMTGAAVWPFVCATWDAQRRLRQIREHFELVDSIGGKLDFPMNETLEVLDLSELQAGLKVVLDQPRWFMREGQLVLNLFAGDVRIYSIAFSLGRDGDRTIAYVGAIQGGNTDGVMADYKDLTKTLHGMRPRDFLVELLRTLCRVLGVSRILAVADERRQHRASYFGTAKADVLSLNYDDIWTERGAVRENDEFFALSIDAPLKSLDDVPSKKRAMYRRRYELLDSLEAAIAATLAGLPQPPLVRSAEVSP